MLLCTVCFQHTSNIEIISCWLRGVLLFRVWCNYFLPAATACFGISRAGYVEILIYCADITKRLVGFQKIFTEIISNVKGRGMF